MNNKTVLKRLLLVIACAGLGLACSTQQTRTGGSVSAQTPTSPAASPPLTPSPPPLPESEEDKMPRVSGAEAIKLVQEGKAIIVDVRSEDAWKMQHVKGALNVPLNKIESGDHKLPKDKRIIAYCT